MALLTGEYEITLDEKNRLLIPAEVRKALSPDPDCTAFFIKLGRNKKPWVYPKARLETLLAANASGMDLNAETPMSHYRDFPFTRELSWDKQGRTVIPERILTKTHTGKDVVLVGMGDHLEMWNTADWEAYTDVIFNDSASKAEAPQAPVAQGNA